MYDKKIKGKNSRKETGIKYKKEINKKMNWYQSIKELYKQKNFSKALIEIEEYLKFYGDDIFATYLYGTILLNLDQIDKAKIEYQKLVSIKSKNMYDAMYQLGCIARREHKKAKSKRIFKQVIEESPYTTDFARIALAEEEYENGNYDEVKKILELVSDDHKNNANYILSRVELSMDNIKEAFNNISKIPKTPNKKFNRRVAIQKGMIEAASYNYKYAIEYYDEALNGPKDNVYWKALLQKAKLENQYYNYDEAILICEVFDRERTDSKEQFIVKGQSYEGKKYYDKATYNYLEATKSTKMVEKEQAYYCLGNMYKNLKDYDNAIYYYDKIKNVKLYYRKAVLNIICIEMIKNNYLVVEEYLNSLIKENILKEDSEEYRKIRILIDKALNRKLTVNKKLTYVEKQYYKYNKYMAVNHIKEKHCGDIENKTIFSSNLDIEELMKNVKPKLIEENKVFDGITEVYIINYPNCGYDIEKNSVDYIKVITVPNTKDIIAMYPFNIDNNIKLNKRFNFEIDEKPKQKRLSQIEKFNKKYNLK